MGLALSATSSAAVPARPGCWTSTATSPPCTGVHLAALVGDTYVRFGAAELLVPLASGWHPLAVAWGVLGMWLLVAVQATSVAMRRLPRRAWRAVHRAAVGVFALVTVHALAAGSEAGNPAARWFALGSLGLVAFLLSFRLLAGQGPRRVARHLNG